MILKITIFSINNQFNELVKAALLEKEELTEQTDFNLEMTDESAKSQDFFQIIRRLKENTSLIEQSQGSFYQKLDMFALIKKISTMKIFYF